MYFSNGEKLKIPTSNIITSSKTLFPFYIKLQTLMRLVENKT